MLLDSETMTNNNQSLIPIIRSSIFQMNPQYKMNRYSLNNRNCYLHQQSLKLGLHVSNFEFQGLGVLWLVVGGLEVWRFGGWVSRFRLFEVSTFWGFGG